MKQTQMLKSTQSQIKGMNIIPLKMNKDYTSLNKTGNKLLLKDDRFSPRQITGKFVNINLSPTLKPITKALSKSPPNAIPTEKTNFEAKYSHKIFCSKKEKKLIKISFKNKKV